MNENEAAPGVLLRGVVVSIEAYRIKELRQRLNDIQENLSRAQDILDKLERA